jgi:CxxC motif-containing protein (DUF1111 family)
MKLPSYSWYLLPLLALAPVGIRVLTWSAPPAHALEKNTVDVGRKLFVHEWKEKDPLAPHGDGLGPVFNANSCATCHHQGGVGGGGDLTHNVTNFTVNFSQDGRTREGVLHAKATKFRETLRDVHPDLPPISQPSLNQILPEHSRHVNGVQVTRPSARRAADQTQPLSLPPNVHLSQRNTPALFGAKLIDELPDRAVIAQERSQRLRRGMASAEGEDLPVGRALRLAGGKVGKFGWKAQSASLGEFVQAACAVELGLGNPGKAQPRPLGRPDYQPPGLDLTAEQCHQMTEFIAALPRPAERAPADPVARSQAEAGKVHFHTVGCADCHTPSLGSIDGIYSDLLLHRMGADLVGGGSYGEPPPSTPDFPPGSGPQPDEWRTPPLWGVADSAPYLHDGRAATLEEAILMHRGQGFRAVRRFTQLRVEQQAQLVSFLKTLRTPQ